MEKPQQGRGGGFGGGGGGGGGGGNNLLDGMPRTEEHNVQTAPPHRQIRTLSLSRHYIYFYKEQWGVKSVVWRGTARCWLRSTPGGGKNLIQVCFLTMDGIGRGRVVRTREGKDR
ncbi:hypothetical protein E2C01_004205 [Portunus trituberculatus]|uniref:Uncharacterized protein n=1 Tax=Portunus trituberculatus TaxID=210409 RepID=A0A5B7CR08_PORTR|nr:hypothetical protein [Portunus trituberculatus]